MDLPYIATLYGSRGADRRGALDLIYDAPNQRTWQPAAASLSGNVKANLAEAQKAGLLTSGTPRRFPAVQPEDVLPGDIDANLGAPWIPEHDIRDFAAALFNVSPAAIRIGHLKKDAVWSVDADSRASGRSPPPPNSERCRANGGLAPRAGAEPGDPVIYDTINHGDREERVVNHEATLAARDKQKQIKERFAPGSLPSLIAPSGWCASITTRITTSVRGSSTGRTWTSPA